MIVKSSGGLSVLSEFDCIPLPRVAFIVLSLDSHSLAESVDIARQGSRGRYSPTFIFYRQQKAPCNRKTQSKRSCSLSVFYMQADSPSKVSLNKPFRNFPSFMIYSLAIFH